LVDNTPFFPPETIPPFSTLLFTPPISAHKFPQKEKSLKGMVLIKENPLRGFKFHGVCYLRDLLGNIFIL
jgi:hypothetical protein